MLNARLWEEREAEEARRWERIRLQRESVCPEDEEQTMTEAEVLMVQYKLRAPFPVEDIEFLPGHKSGDGKRAMAMPFADARCYEKRLDEVLGPFGWQTEFRKVGDESIICRLTIHGVSKEQIGECKAMIGSKPNENQWTTMVAQAFKRACSAFGIGRYLYDLPEKWGDIDQYGHFKDTFKMACDIYREGKVKEWYSLQNPNKPVQAEGAEKVSEFMRSGAKVTAQDVAAQAGIATADQVPAVDGAVIRTFKDMAGRCQNEDDLRVLAQHMKKEKESGLVDEATLQACRMIWQRRQVELAPRTLDVTQ